MNDDTSCLLDELIAGYLRGEEHQRLVDRERLLAEHPKLAAELEQFFADRDRVSAAVAPVSLPRRKPLATIRYFGDYELLEEIACGGMGVVYRARQRSLDRTVAVKTIRAGKFATDDDEKRFLAEAQAAAGLEHEGIVPIYEVGRYDGQYFFSMRYVDGQSLAELARQRPLPVCRAATYVKQTAEAIHYAHRQGILHRDVKPPNILVDANDRVQVTDFGLATRVAAESDRTRTGQVLGTPSYMSPEQAQGKRYLLGPPSDVYSLGVVLYELITGRPPFRAETAVETLRQVVEMEPAPPRLLNPQVLRDLETICLKCLQKEPHRRYDTAGELAEDLDCFLQGRPISARAVGYMERSWRWCRRNAMVALLAVCSLVLLLSTTSVAGVAYLREIDARNQVAQQVAGELATARSLVKVGSDRLPEFSSLARALEAIDRATALLKDRDVEEPLVQQVLSLKQQLSSLQRDERLVADLEAAWQQQMEHEIAVDRLNAALDISPGHPSLRSLNEGAIDPLRSYEHAFARWGLAVDQTTTTEAVKRIRLLHASQQPQIFASLDRWRSLLKKPMSIYQWQQAGWSALVPVELRSRGGDILESLEDGSILARGENAWAGYDLVFDTDATHLTALRLEALLHDSLPRRGPGRAGGPVKRQGGFAIRGLAVSFAPKSNPMAKRRLKFSTAVADYAWSQQIRKIREHLIGTAQTLARDYRDRTAGQKTETEEDLRFELLNKKLSRDDERATVIMRSRHEPLSIPSIQVKKNDRMGPWTVRSARGRSDTDMLRFDVTLPIENAEGPPEGAAQAPSEELSDPSGLDLEERLREVRTQSLKLEHRYGLFLVLKGRYAMDEVASVCSRLGYYAEHDPCFLAMQDARQVTNAREWYSYCQLPLVQILDVDEPLTKRDLDQVSEKASAIAVDGKRLFGENGEVLSIVSNSEQLKIFVLAAEELSTDQLAQLRQNAAVTAFVFSDSTE